MLYGKQQGTLALGWPTNVYGPLKKLGELCLSNDSSSRPTAEQVRHMGPAGTGAGVAHVAAWQQRVKAGQVSG